METGTHASDRELADAELADPELRGWLERLPKVELHLHIEGAIPHAALWELITKYGGDPSVPTAADLPGRFFYRDFPDFIDRWIWKHGFIRETDDFTLIGRAVAGELARQRILYAEAFFTPSDVARFGMTPQQVAVALRRGLASVPDVEVALISDVCRDAGPEIGAENLEKIAEVAAEAGVIGIGLGGSEQSFPPEPYARVYERARGLGLHVTAHAGEVAGPESVWGALRALGVERVDHGTRAVEDPALMEWLVERRIPVTSCPGSNVATGAVASLEDHPIRRFVDAGLLVSIATDDPAMFGLSMAGEFEALVRRLGFSRAEVRALTLDAVESTWLPPDRKAALRARVEADPAWGEQGVAARTGIA
jgi:adenosine deaminase